METRRFGETGLSFPRLGLGTGRLGELDERSALALLARAHELDFGLLDTARSYGASEALIGRFLREQPRAFGVSTKIGYGIEGLEDWTGPCIAAGVDAALQRLGVEQIEVVHLHSCPVATLERDDVLRALDDAVSAGKVQVMAYSGDNEGLDHAIASGRFGSVEASLSVCDRRNEASLARAKEAGMGVIAKRALANAPWRFADRPIGDEADKYWSRWRALELEALPMDPFERCLRFAAFHPSVDVCLIGTNRPERLEAAAEVLDRGPLPPEFSNRLDSAYQRNGRDWLAIV